MNGGEPLRSFVTDDLNMKGPSSDMIACEYCGHGGARIRFNFGDTKIFSCKTCGASFTYPMPTLTDLSAVYSEGYFTNEGLTSGAVEKTYGYRDYQAFKKTNEREYGRICGQLVKLVTGSPEGKRLLDYGCGLGFFLEVCGSHGFEVEGIEFNSYAVDRIRSEYGFNVHEGTSLADLPDPEVRYNVIVMLDVVEHLRDPKREIQRAYDLLHDGGILLIGTTDFNHLIPRVLGKRFEDFRRTLEHIFFFGKKDMIANVAKSGFQLIDCEPQRIVMAAGELGNRLVSMGVPGATVLSRITESTPFQNVRIPVNLGMKYLAYFRKRALPHHPAQENQPLSYPLRLNVIIPVFNEEKTIEQVIKRVRDVHIDGVVIDIIVVDDGSTDSTCILLRQLQQIHEFQLLEKPRNQGKGSALSAGFAHADSDIVIIQDADLEYEPGDYAKLIHPIVSGDADAVYGSRFLSPERRVMGFWHTYGNKFLTFICNMVVNLNITDMETCYKVMKTEVAKSLAIKSRRFDVEPEITCKLARQKRRIYEVPIKYYARSFKEGKKIGFKDVFHALWAIYKYGILRLR